MADVLEIAKARPIDEFTGNRLVGDLHSTPDPLRRLVDQDVYALEWARQYAGPSEIPWIDMMIRQRQEQLRSELAKADLILDAMIRTRINHQMRCRPDSTNGKLAVEQWIPALRSWIVNGYFESNTPSWEIIRVLEAGDPTKKNAEQALAEARENAAAQRERNEAAGDQKVKDVVSSLSDKRVEQFVDVERALHTGENITVRGDDRRSIEKMVEDTRTAAHRGDAEAQQVIENKGVRDNPTCILPTTNPFRHRHRKELERQ